MRLSAGSAGVRVRREARLPAGRRSQAVRAEVRENPRSASARLRVATRTAEPSEDRWLMAAPQRRYRAPLPTEAGVASTRGSGGKVPERHVAPEGRRPPSPVCHAGRGAGVLMLGSVYLHTVAAGLDARATELGDSLAEPRTKGRGSRSKSRSCGLGEDQRARRKARYEPAGSGELKVYGNEPEQSGGWDTGWGTTGRRGAAVEPIGPDVATRSAGEARLPPSHQNPGSSDPGWQSHTRSRVGGARDNGRRTPRVVPRRRPGADRRAQATVDRRRGLHRERPAPGREGGADQPHGRRGLQGLRRRAGWDRHPAAPPTRGSIISADGMELATSLEAARVIATPYQIEDAQRPRRTAEGVIGPETDRERGRA